MSESTVPIEVLPREGVNFNRMRLLLRTPPEEMSLPQVAEAVAILRAIAGVARRRDDQLSDFIKEGSVFEHVPADPRGHKRIEAGEVVLTLERRPALGERKRKARIVRKGVLPPGTPREPELLEHLRTVLSPQDFERCTQVSIDLDRLQLLVQLGAIAPATLEPYFDAPIDEEEPIERPPIFALKLGPRGDLEGLLRMIEGHQPD